MGHGRPPEKVGPLDDRTQLDVTNNLRLADGVTRRDVTIRRRTISHSRSRFILLAGKNTQSSVTLASPVSLPSAACLNVSLLRFLSVNDDYSLARLEPFETAAVKYSGAGMSVIYRGRSNNYSVVCTWM